MGGVVAGKCEHLQVEEKAAKWFFVNFFLKCMLKKFEIKIIASYILNILILIP